MSEISSSLECFGFLNAMKAKSDAFYHVFYPWNIFSWDYDSFVQRFWANFSEDGSNDQLKEVNVYKVFVDFVESSFMVRWSWKVLFIYETISCTLLILIQFIILVFGILSLLLDWIFMAQRFILFAKMWSLICYKSVFNINNNNAALLKH